MATVAPVVGTPTYSAGMETIVTTYGDGTVKSTATNNATAAPVTWGTDHTTKTTTYTFADGTKNPVVVSVQPTLQGLAYTAPSYTNLSTTGAVTKPSVTALSKLYGDSTTITLESGTTSLPFNQATLSALNITDPNAIVKAPSSTIYDLSWGTPDKIGPGYAALFSNGSVTQIISPVTLNFWGNTVSGQCLLGPYFGYCLNGPTIGTPHSDVINAWLQGWTGKGVNILIEDALTQTHGTVTALLANRYAIGATMYGYDFQYNRGIYNLNGTAARPSISQNIGVINASFGANLPYLIGHNKPWSDIELATAAINSKSFTDAAINRYTGAIGWTNFNEKDAVIVKAAGNDSITADKEPLVSALSKNQDIQKRLLVVGALNKAGGPSYGLATIMNYSNSASTNLNVQNRFLVASGTTPFGTGDLALNGNPVDATLSTDPNGYKLGNVGTSYAAPRVAGYAAIVRQKFPNLTGANTSDILLQTARYDTLTCNPNCDKSIYGQGEASLSRALAPVGRLR